MVILHVALAGGREREKDRDNSSSKTLILRDCGVRSIWTYLTASPCYATNRNKHDDRTTDIMNRNKQLINAVAQSSYKTSELHFLQGYTCMFLRKHVIQTDPSKFDGFV